MVGMTNNIFEQKTEIAPGIYFLLRNGNYSLVLEVNDNDQLICWDYEEVKRDPNSWFITMKAVALATQHGPEIAHDWIKAKLSKLDTPAGTIFCNICKIKFEPGENHPYVFIATLNGHKYRDLQCSLECTKKRRSEVYALEMGQEFSKLLANISSKK